MATRIPAKDTPHEAFMKRAASMTLDEMREFMEAAGILDAAGNVIDHFSPPKKPRARTGRRTPTPARRKTKAQADRPKRLKAATKRVMKKHDKMLRKLAR